MMAIRNICRAILIGLTLSSIGCSRGGMAAGSFSAYFNEPADAQKIALGKPTVISYNGNRIEITPRHRLGDKDQVVAYSVTVNYGLKWDLREDNDFRARLLEHISPSPAEIYGIGLSDLKYSQRQFARQETIKAFWEYLWSRPHSGYSIEEVRQLIPAEYVKSLDVNVTSSRTFVFDWPHDERSLILTFTYDKYKEAALLQGYELNYPDNMNKTPNKPATGAGK